MLLYTNYYPIQCTVVSKESLSKPCLLHSSSCDKPYPKEDREEQSFSKTTQDLESFFSPLGEPDLRDLPSFAYQISLGMVYKCSQMYTKPEHVTYTQ